MSCDALTEVLRKAAGDDAKRMAMCLGAFGTEAEPAAELVQEAIFSGSVREDAIAVMRKIRPGKPVQLRPGVASDADEMLDLDL